MRAKLAFALAMLLLPVGCTPHLVPETVCAKGLDNKLTNSVLLVEVPNDMKSLRTKLEREIIANFSAKNCKLYLYEETAIQLNSDGFSEFVKTVNAIKFFQSRSLISR